MSNYLKLLIAVILVLGALALSLILNHNSGSVLISNAQAVHLNGKMYAVYLNMENPGAPDILTEVKGDDAQRIFVMGGEGALVLPQGSKPGFSADGAHIMVGLKPSVEISAGEFIPLTLMFERAGAQQIKALVKQNDAATATGGGMDHSQHGMAHHLKAGEAVPEIKMVVTRNANKGWDLELQTQNFEFFEPSSEPMIHQPGKGHGHLYLNGLKLQRMYSKKASIGALPAGKHKIVVTLNTNDHKAYWSDDQAVSAVAEIEVQ